MIVVSAAADLSCADASASSLEPCSPDLCSSSKAQMLNSPSQSLPSEYVRCYSNESFSDDEV